MHPELPDLPPGSHILVGLSGGVDSVVLLHWLCQLAPAQAWSLSALHVHHGLSPNANAWAKFCAQLCLAWGVPLRIERVEVAPLRAEWGVEAAARQLRRAALLRQPCDVIALAHHADDQAETVLLQLLRGAGVRGTSGMSVRGGVDYSASTPTLTLPLQGRGDKLLGKAKVESKFEPPILRPLLTTPRAAILNYAQTHALQWIEDESNADPHYARNFLRQQVMPLLADKFPGYRQTLTRSAQHFAEAASLLDELAALDGGACGATLPLARLQGLSAARGKNLLRYFLDRCGAPMPPSARLADLHHQLLTAREDAQVCVEYGGWQVRRYRGEVYALPQLPEVDGHFSLTWQGESELPWPPLNARIHFKTVDANLFAHLTGENVRINSHLQIPLPTDAPLTLRLRQGGETLRLHPHDPHHHSLKKWLQAQHIPPWLRARLPLLYHGDTLLTVLGAQS